jgi:hypothetical protein
MRQIILAACPKCKKNATQVDQTEHHSKWRCLNCDHYFLIANTEEVQPIHNTYIENRIILSSDPSFVIPSEPEPKIAGRGCSLILGVFFIVIFAIPFHLLGKMDTKSTGITWRDRLVFFGIVSESSSIQSNTETKPIGNPLTQISYTNVLFDMPAILDMSLNDLGKHLGKPTITFKPNQTQIDLGIEYDAEYKRGDIIFSFSYNRDGSITKYMLSSSRKRDTKRYIMQSCKLTDSNAKYRVKINSWLNPIKAKQDGNPEIPSIEIIKK